MQRQPVQQQQSKREPEDKKKQGHPCRPLSNSAVWSYLAVLRRTILLSRRDPLAARGRGGRHALAHVDLRIESKAKRTIVATRGSATLCEVLPRTIPRRVPAVAPSPCRGFFVGGRRSLITPRDKPLAWRGGSLMHAPARDAYPLPAWSKIA